MDPTTESPSLTPAESRSEDIAVDGDASAPAKAAAKVGASLALSESRWQQRLS